MARIPAYNVSVIPPGAFNGYRAEVRRGALRGIGYAKTERWAIRKAWTDYWRNHDKVV